MLDELRLRQFEEKLRIRGYSEKTVYETMHDLKLFIAYLREKENVTSMIQIEAKHVKSYQTYLTFEKFPRARPRDGTPHHLSQNTRRHRLGALIQFFRIMHEECLLPHDYSSCIVAVKKTAYLPKNIPSSEEMRRLIQAAVPDNPLGIRDRFMLELMYATGIRNTEVRSLKVQDLSIHDRTVFIKGKGDIERIVPIGEWVMPYAMEHLHIGRPYLLRLKNTDLLFPTRNGNLIDTSMLHRIVTFYRKKAGMDIKISPHTFRHACATHMLQGGADVRYVQELLGHQDLGSTQTYTRVTINDLKKAHAKYHPANRDGF